MFDINNIIDIKLGIKLKETTEALEVSKEFLHQYLLLILIISSLIASFIYILLEDSNTALWILAFSFFLLAISSYVIAVNVIEIRKEKMENSLPLFLEIFAFNLKGEKGIMTSLENAAKPEFGFFSDKIKKLTKRSLEREAMIKNFKEMNKFFRSEIFEKTANVIDSVIKNRKSFAALSEILKRRASDIRDLQTTKNEMRSKMETNVIFICIAIILIIPIILSIHTINIINTEIISASNIYLSLVIINSILGSTFIGAIKYNKYLRGFVYFPFLIVGSIIVYYLSKSYLLDYLIIV